MKYEDIIERALDQKLYKYLDECSEANDNYDECNDKINKEAETHIIKLAQLVKEFAIEYDFDTRTVLDEMIYPSIEAKVF